MMGKPTEDENNTKLKIVNWVIDRQLKRSNPAKNECTEKIVLERANKIVNRLGFKNISRSTLLQSKTPEWIATNKRIQDQRENYGKIKKVADRELKERIKELEELCNSQNTKLMEYLTRIEKLEMEKIEHEELIGDLIDQARALKEQT